jgi:hypothetical protein
MRNVRVGGHFLTLRADAVLVHANAGATDFSTRPSVFLVARTELAEVRSTRRRGLRTPK